MTSRAAVGKGPLAGDSLKESELSKRKIEKGNLSRPLMSLGSHVSLIQQCSVSMFQKLAKNLKNLKNWNNLTKLQNFQTT